MGHPFTVNRRKYAQNARRKEGKIMPQILLTNKEIDNATPTKQEVLEFKNTLTSDKVEGWDSMPESERVLTAFSILANTRTAKAQLKKAANWLKNLPTDGHDKWYWYHQDLAEQLLKECE